MNEADSVFYVAIKSEPKSTYFTIYIELSKSLEALFSYFYLTAEPIDIFITLKLQI